MKQITNEPIFFITPVISRSLGLEEVLPNFYIITTSKDSIIPILRSRNISVFCLEEVSDQVIKNSFELLNAPEVKEFIKISSNDKTPNILTFRSLPQIKKICEVNQYRYLQSDPYVVRELEDKVLFHQLLLKNSIKTIPTEIHTLDNYKFKGKRIILQLRRGFAGNSSFIIENESQLEDLKKNYKNHQVKISEFINGITLTINGFISDDKIKTGAFFIQIDGETTLNKNPLGTCGNSHFTDFIPEEKKKEIYNEINKISIAIQKKGFRGFFGLDLRLSDDGGIFPIECNPRLTASIGNYTQMEIFKNKTPLLLNHILYFIDNKAPVEDSILNDLNYSFIVFRNVDEEKIVNTNLISGIYNFDENLKFIKNSTNFTNCNEKEYYLQIANVNSKIQTNKEYLYLLSKQNLIAYGHIKDDVKTMLKQFNNLILKRA